MAFLAVKKGCGGLGLAAVGEVLAALVAKASKGMATGLLALVPIVGTAEGLAGAVCDAESLGSSAKTLGATAVADTTIALVGLAARALAVIAGVDGWILFFNTGELDVAVEPAPEASALEEACTLG